MSAGGLKQSRNRKKVMLVAVAAGTVLVVAALFAILLSIQNNPQLITIWGNVNVQDLQKQPIEISFHEEYGGHSYSAPINDAGFYQTQLPEGERNYDVKVSWLNSEGSTGICYAGSLNYDGTSLPLIRDFGC